MGVGIENVSARSDRRLRGKAAWNRGGNRCDEIRDHAISSRRDSLSHARLPPGEDIDIPPNPHSAEPAGGSRRTDNLHGSSHGGRNRRVRSIYAIPNDAGCGDMPHSGDAPRRSRSCDRRAIPSGIARRIAQEMGIFITSNDEVMRRSGAGSASGEIQSSRGAVRTSRSVSPWMASAADEPHISGLGRRLTQTAGRSGRPNRRQRFSSVNCTQRTPAGFPDGMPGIGVDMEGAMQHAPHPTRHSIMGSDRIQRRASARRRSANIQQRPSAAPASRADANALMMPAPRSHGALPELKLLVKNVVSPIGDEPDMFHGGSAWFACDGALRSRLVGATDGARPDMASESAPALRVSCGRDLSGGCAPPFHRTKEASAPPEANRFSLRKYPASPIRVHIIPS